TVRSSRGGRRSIRHSTRCLTASKPITPRAMASLTPASTSSGWNTSSSRSTWTNSRLPRLAMRASIRRRSVANSAGRSQPTSGAALVESANFLFEQRQIMQWVEDKVLARVGARITGDHLAAAGDHHLVDIAADQNLAVAISGRHRVVGAAIAHQQLRTDPACLFLAGVVVLLSHKIRDRVFSLADNRKM